MAKKLALGKGIASLLQETTSSRDLSPPPPIHSVPGFEQEEEEREVVREIVVENRPLLIHVSMIKTNPNQPRKIFKEKDLEELSESIKENGIIQPLIVAEMDGGYYELVAGERRLRAAKKAGLEQVPVVVKRATEKEKMIMSIIENVQRSDLNCVEEALAYYQLMNEYKLTQEEVAKKLGKERSSVANFLRILNLPRAVLELLQKETLSFGHAKILVSVKEKEEAIRLANQAVVHNWSVRELEQEMKSKKPAKEKSGETTSFFNEKIDQFRKLLEQKTGYHFGINTGKNGSGQVVIKFSNEAEFNDIYEYLLKK
jgi:ParB family chromosome partitioning protein